MKKLAVALFFALAVPASAVEPDGLLLPPGFHAEVVADGVGPARHMAIRDNGDIYISTRRERDGAPILGVVALRLGPDHKVADMQHFGTVDNGTGIRIYKGALYVASPSTLYRYTFKGNELVPSAQPQVVVDGMPSTGHTNVGVGFDGKGHLYLSISGQDNICTDPNAPKGGRPVGLKPCPSLTGRAGVWVFNAGKLNQKFPADGQQIATGVRDMMAVAWSNDFHGLYGVMQDRNGTAHSFGDAISEGADADSIAEEMHRVDKGADLGWPYTYYDRSLKQRVTAPEYGGDGKTAPTDGHYSTPIVAFSAHESPLDMLFYDGHGFPARYHGGAFVVFHGGSGPVLASGHHGYDVVFVPFDKAGKPGEPEPFAMGFAGSDPADKNPGKAKYRPTGAAVGKDGSLYVVEGEKGRVWRISHDAKG